MWYIWLIAAGIFFIVEIATIGFLIFWLGIGALLAMIASFFTDINTIEATGQVKVEGEVWSAKSDSNIEKGTEVEILKIDGVKLVVKPKGK